MYILFISTDGVNFHLQILRMKCFSDAKFFFRQKTRISRVVLAPLYSVSSIINRYPILQDCFDQGCKWDKVDGL